MILYVLILAVLQGITEFLPVSSSGHLALGSHLFYGFDQPGIIFEILLHCATSIAVIIYMRKELWNMLKSLFIFNKVKQNTETANLIDERIKYRRLFLMVIIASIPTGIIGFLLRETAEKAFNIDWMVAAGFLVTGCVLFASRFISADGKNLFDISLMQALLIGVFQGIAVFPGVSRSGMTITAGLRTGCKPEASAKFSFLLSLPAIFGALILDIKNLNSIKSEYLLTFLIGMIVAAVVGYFSIKLVVSVTKKWKLHYFAPYCILLGIILLIFK
jgi:undecaprenyl-diphosphatase